MTKEICSGASPWRCSPEAARAALELARRDSLPVGPEAKAIDVVALIAKIRENDYRQAVLETSHRCHDGQK